MMELEKMTKIFLIHFYPNLAVDHLNFQLPVAEAEKAVVVRAEVRRAKKRIL